MAQNYDTTNTRTTVARRISWPAVFAGLVIGLAIQLLLGLLGVAIGASTVNPMQGDTPGKGMAIGAGIWFLIAGLISTYVGACTAAYLSGSTRKSDRMLHGVLSWALASLLTAVLLSSAIGSLLGGAMRFASAATTGAAQGMALRLGNNSGQPSNTDVSAAKNEVREAAGATGSQSTETSGSSVQTEQKARQAADTAAKGTAVSAWWSFAVLLLGLLVAAYAGATERRYYHNVTGEPARS